MAIPQTCKDGCALKMCGVAADSPADLAQGNRWQLLDNLIAEKTHPSLPLIPRRSPGTVFLVL